MRRSIGILLPASWASGEQESLLPTLRWAALLALLFVEFIGLSVWIDTGALVGRVGWSPYLLQQSPVVVRFAIVVITAMVAFSAANIRTAVVELGNASARSSDAWRVYLLGHLVSVALFATLTHAMVHSDLLDAWPSGPIGMVWGATGLLALIGWSAAVLPLGLWWRLFTKLRGMLSVAAVIGAMCVATGSFATPLWRLMSAWTLALVQAQLSFFTEHTICDPAESIVGTESFSVMIAASCSGYEGIGLILVFLSAYLWCFRDRLRFPQALLLLPLGAIVIWIGNSLRITALILIGTWGWPEIAAGGFHSQAGWLAFCGIGLGLVAVSGRSRFLVAAPARVDRVATRATRGQQTNHVSPFLIPFLAVLATTMVTTAFSRGADTLYPLRVIAVVAVLWWFRDAYRQMRWSWSWQAAGVGVLVAGFWLWAISPAASPEPTSIAPAGWAGLPAAFWWSMRLFGYVITVPIAEELAFRGFLTRQLIRADFEEVPVGKFTWFSWVGSSVLFGLMHGQYWLLGTIAGLLFAAVLYRRGRICDAVVAHMSTNGGIAAYALWTGNWSLLS